MASDALTGGKLEKVLAALDANWQAEMEGHRTYQTLAEHDSDPVRALVLRHLWRRMGARGTVGRPHP